MTLDIKVGPPQLSVHQGYTIMVSDPATLRRQAEIVIAVARDGVSDAAGLADCEKRFQAFTTDVATRPSETLRTLRHPPQPGQTDIVDRSQRDVR